MAEIIITIDGPAGVGKTSLARALAKELGFRYFDTGAMYRALALIAYEKNIEVTEKKRLKEIALSLPLVFHENETELKVFLKDRDISKEIRRPSIGMLASTISQWQEVREAMWERQRQLADEAKRAIFEGRDMGTVVFPQAQVKFFLIASPEIRAQRRLKQLQALGEDVNYKDIYESILKRDKQDSKRTISPLKPANDAIIIDTTTINLGEAVKLAVNYTLNKIGRSLEWTVWKAK